MKTLLIITVLALFAITSNAQLPYVKFTYDSAGNRTFRTIVLGIQTGRLSNPAASLHADTLSTAQQEQQLQPVKETLSTGQTVTIYPNPTRGLLAVEITNAGASTGSATASLQIVDVSGKQHYIKNKIAGREEINLSGVPAGVYFLRVVIDGKMEEWKIIKQ